MNATLLLSIQLVLAFLCPPIAFGARKVFPSDVWCFFWVFGCVFFSVAYPKFLDKIRIPRIEFKKAAYFFLIFCGIGFAHLIRKNFRQALLLGTLLFLSTAGPIIATYIGKYYFLPRQVAGGTVVFLGMAALGLRLSQEKLIKRWGKACGFVLTALALLIISASWAAFIYGKPPFIDQPLHRFEQVAEAAKQAEVKNVLWLDSGTAGSAFFYFKSVYNNPSAVAVNQTLGGIKMAKLCVTPQTCVYSMTDDAFVWDSAKMIQTSQVKSLLEGRVIPFDLVVHSFYKFPVEINTPTLRIW